MHRKRYTSLASAKLSNIDKSQLVGRRERVLMTDVRLVWLLVASFILVGRPIAAQDTREAAARAYPGGTPSKLGPKCLSFPED